jgi:hypothetical protein
MGWLTRLRVLMPFPSNSTSQLEYRRTGCGKTPWER